MPEGFLFDIVNSNQLLVGTEAIGQNLLAVI